MRLLIILKDYPPNPSPNGYLTKMLVDELQLQHDDIEVDIITARINKQLPLVEHVNSKVTIYRLPSKREKYEELTKQYLETRNPIKKLCLRTYLHFTRGYVDKHDYDIYRHFSFKEAYKLASKMHKESNYDAVLSVSYPFEVHYPALFFKKKYPQVHWSLCLMEPHADNVARFGEVKSKAIKKAAKQENLFFPHADSIITAEPIVTHARFSQIPKYIDKIYTIYGKNLYDNTAYNQSSNDSKLHVVFSGNCNSKRDPEYLLQLWKYVDENIILHIYAGGDKQIVNKCKCVADETENIIFHGYVPFDELEQAHQKADAFINMGWFVNNLIPSKIFDYMSFGKPIINLYSVSNDTSNPFLKMYPCSLCLKVSEDDIKISAEKISDFCIANKSTRLDYDTVRKEMGDINLEGGTDRFYRIINEDSSLDKIQKLDWEG